MALPCCCAVLQDADDVLKVHWSLKRFISWQQQHMQTPLAASSKQQQEGSSSGSGGGGTTAQQQPWQQQQFQQLLGPQLQLLTAMQAAAVQSPCLLQQLPAKHRPPSSPSKLGMSSSSLASDPQAQQQLQQGSGLGVVGVLAGVLNPSHQQQWVPGSGCLWDSLQVALMEVLVNAARLANAPVDAWEAAATLLRWVGRHTCNLLDAARLHRSALYGSPAHAVPPALASPFLLPRVWQHQHPAATWAATSKPSPPASLLLMSCPHAVRTQGVLPAAAPGPAVVPHGDTGNLRGSNGHAAEVQAGTRAGAAGAAQTDSAR